ncbi:MAG: hypothetical protein ACI8RZ_003655, partial [Myxococcota bacterium]
DTDADTDADTDVDVGECDHFSATRNAYFGDLHVHSSYSFDSYLLGNYVDDPEVAYRFAKGEEVGVPPFEYDGTPQNGRTAKLRAPLDFAAVTDHAEFFAETSYCTQPPETGFACGVGDASRYIYCSVECLQFRTVSPIDELAGIDVVFMDWGAVLSDEVPEPVAAICDEDENGVSEAIDCDARQDSTWAQIQQITTEANDPCEFTAFQGYEYSRAVGDASAMLHRNIIFRTDDVITSPISAIETPDPYDMLSTIRDGCEALDDCEFMSIPHNSNLSFGLMFQVEDAEDGTVLTQERAELRAVYEPLIEIVQAKGSSECKSGFSYLGAEADEFCDFESELTLCSAPGADPDQCFEECDPDNPNTGRDAYTDDDGIEHAAVPGCMASTDYLRNALKEGLLLQDDLGVNPFQLGFIGSTDTHNGMPGNTEEWPYVGTHGYLDDEPAELVDYESSILANLENPGGLAGIWATENTRDSLFDAMQRRETFATSGTRITTRFFGGWDFDADLCDDPTLLEAAYASGVPMGGTLPADTTQAPTFLAWAARAPDSVDGDGLSWEGTQLQRIQVIKVWTDAAGEAHELVYDITDNPDNGASVNEDTCEMQGSGSDELCAVWTDPDFNTEERATYYTRVLENPTCRYSGWVCMENADQYDCSDESSEDYWEGCCDEDLSRTIQERAWTSPIWFEPGQ